MPITVTPRGNPNVLYCAGAHPAVPQAVAISEHPSQPTTPLPAQGLATSNSDSGLQRMSVMHRSHAHRAQVLYAKPLDTRRILQGVAAPASKKAPDANACLAPSNHREGLSRETLGESYSNNQSEKLLDEFAALAMDKSAPRISIIKKDGKIIGKDGICQIRKRLANQEGQVLWAVTVHGDFIFGFKPLGGSPIKHSILANADDKLVMLLEKPWEDASVDICTLWLPAKEHILNNESARVISAGCMRAHKLTDKNFKIVFDNESGHFEPSAASFGIINKSSEYLKRLSDESFCIAEVDYRHYTPGGFA